MRPLRRTPSPLLLTSAALLVVCLALSLAEDPPANSPSGAPIDLVVFYSNDLQGELEPCGCTEGQLGGLTRRSSWIRATRERGEHVLLLDAGDLYFRREAIPDILKPQLALKARTIAGIYDSVKYGPGTLGELDLALGKEAFEGLNRPPLAENVRGLDARAARVEDVGGCRVGVFGLAAPGTGKTDGIEVLDPKDATSRAVADLKKRANLVVCVSHLGLDGDKALAAAVGGIDVIVGGHDCLSLELPIRVGRTLIVQANKQGKFLGRLTLHLRPDWRSADLLDASQNERWRELGVEYEAAVAQFAKERDAAATPGDRERAQANVDLYAKQAKEARDNVRDLSDRSWFANRLVPLDARVPDDPEVAKAVLLYKEEARKLNESLAASLAAAPREGPSYLGAAACVKCHAAENDQWSKTPHAHAYEILVQRKQEMDLECVGCHTTAFQEKGGFFLPSKVGDCKGVQCEACHGPGEGHPDRKMVLTPPKETCVRCHQPPQQEGFSYEASLPKTKHTK